MATNPSRIGMEPLPTDVSIDVVPVSGPIALPAPDEELALPAPVEELALPAPDEELSAERPLMETLLQSYAEQAGRLLGLVVRYSDKLSRQASSYSRQAYQQTSEKAKVYSDKTQQQIARVRREHPMEAIGIMCGIGVIAGITLRVWGSRKS